MNSIENKLLLHLSLICLLLITISALNAQSKQTYNGSFLLKNDIQGKAKYSYYLERKDTIKQGDFSFLSIEETKDLYKCIEIEGFYNKNFKSEKWSYRFKNLNKGGLETIEENKLIYETSGQEKIVLGEYQSSKVNGDWIVIEQHIKSSKSVDTINFVKANYTNGILSGEIVAFNNDFDFLGYTNKNGLADKKWTITHKDLNLVEYRVYENGIIKNHCFEENGDTIFCDYVPIDHIINKDEVWENIDIDEKYFALLRYLNLGVKNNDSEFEDDSYFEKIKHSDDFILSMFSNISEEKQVDFGNFLEGSGSIQKAKAKVRKYPFTKEEKSEMSKAHDLLLKNMKTIGDFFKNLDVEINIYTNENLMFTYKVMKIFKDNFDKQKKYLDKISKPEYEYLNRNSFLEKTLPYPDYPDTVSYTFKGSENAKAYDFPKINLEQENKFQILIDHLTEMGVALKEIEGLSSKYLSKSNKESKLEPLEKEMVIKKDSILNLYSNLSNKGDFNQYHKDMAEKMKAMVNEEFKNYSELSLEDKMDAIVRLNDCFEIVLKFYEKQAEIPQKIERLDEVYSRVVFNPYTFTDMEERIKERIYKSYENVLKDLVIEGMQNAASCDKLKDKYNSFELLYRKMMVLRDRDTKDIEKELRRVNDPQKILDIMELEIDIN